MEDQFLIVFILTVLITRFSVYFFPVSSPTIGKFRIHHYMYGIVGIVAGIFLHSWIVYAIGLGLFVDELTYLLIRGKTHADNYSVKSIVGTVLFCIAVFLLRSYVMSPIQ